MTWVVGLTGGIGSGKSTVVELFAKKGVSIIDADKITRDLTLPYQPALLKIVEHFGKDILHTEGTLNRAKLRKIIFDNPEEKQWLEKLLHPLVRIAMIHQAETSTSPYCIAVIPLLFETEKNPLINRTLVVDIDEEIQINRTIQRDQSSKEEVMAILKAQISREKRLAMADDVIDNTHNFEELVPQVEKLHRLYLLIAAQGNG
jgi:dephospho-CoA kinase